MHICVVAEGYPTKDDPFLPFVRALFSEVAKQGVQCSVIAPQSITRAIAHRVPVRPVEWVDEVDENTRIRVYQPRYITLSNRVAALNRKLFLHAARRAYKKLAGTVDVLYGHFWHMGVFAAQLDANLPVFVACGESRISVHRRYGQEEIEALQKRLAGVIYVGTKSWQESVDLSLQKDTPYLIAPNGYHPDKFFQKDRQQVRQALGWDPDAYIVCFVGAFSERKGSARLEAALAKTKCRAKAVFVGKGENRPTGDSVLFAGGAAHDEVVNYLNAADVFVLPTNNEGCCNAIVEALACGLPVISSHQPFNEDILDESCSIRIDPMDVDAIAQAIDCLHDDPERRAHMAQAALRKAETLQIGARASRIIHFIMSCVSQTKES